MDSNKGIQSAQQAKLNRQVSRNANNTDPDTMLLNQLQDSPPSTEMLATEPSSSIPTKLPTLPISENAPLQLNRYNLGEGATLIEDLEQAAKNQTIITNYDKDGDGKLNAEELATYFKANPYTTVTLNEQTRNTSTIISTDLVTDDVKNKYDKNNNGVIDYYQLASYNSGEGVKLIEDLEPKS